MRPILPLCILVLLVATGSATGAPPDAASAAAPASGTRSYGEPITAGATVPLAAVLARPDEYAGKTVIVEGRVRAACQRKGCWMELAESEDKAEPACRVTFKDYGFFVPTASIGAQARVQGVVDVHTLESGYVKHLEEEGARFTRRNDDGSASEVRLIATGVELTQ